MGRRRSFVLRLLLTIAVLVIAGFLTRSLWLPVAGYALIHDDGPAKADLVVVLAGDAYGNRIERAAQLVREGYVPAVLVSGPPGFYGKHECDFAIPYIVSKGYPAEWFIPLPHSALSTKDEAAVILAELARRGVHSFLVVTSDYHTGRSARIFRAAERARGGGPSMRMVAARDEYFRAGSWWLTRESQKVVFMEWCKTFASAAGM